jgi:hypothetical protein
MSAPSFVYVNEDAIDEELLCNHICFQPLDEPLSHKFCGNSFCRSCIEKIEWKCPICRTTGAEDDYPKVARLVTNLLAKLLVQCSLCSQEMTRGDFDYHKSVCTHIEVPCPAALLGCTAHIRRGELETHIKECRYELSRVLMEPLKKEIQTLDTKYKQEITQLHQELATVNNKYTTLENKYTKLENNYTQVLRTLDALNHPIVNVPSHDTIVFQPVPSDVILSDRYTVTKTGHNSAKTILTSLEMNENKVYYFEVTVKNGRQVSDMMVGVCDKNTYIPDGFLSHHARGWALYTNGGTIYHNSKSEMYLHHSVPSNSKIGCLVDFTSGTGTMHFVVNGVDHATAFTGITKPVSAAVTLFASGDSITINSNARREVVPRPVSDTFIDVIKFRDPPLGVRISGNNETVTNIVDSVAKTILTTLNFTENRIYYFEVTIYNGKSVSDMMVGVCDESTYSPSAFMSHNSRGWAIYTNGGTVYHNSRCQTYLSASIPSNVTVGCVVDFSSGNGSMYFIVNGVSYGLACSSITRPVCAAVTLYSIGDVIKINQGAKLKVLDFKTRGARS